MLLVARTRYRLPLSPSLEKKFAALEERFELRVLATAADGHAQDDGVFRLVGKLPLLDGLLFYVLLPWRIRQIVRDHRPDAIVAQSPYEALFVIAARPKAKLVVELHGDWHTATRLYGSPLRRALSPLTDRLAAWAVRRADAVRAVSDFTAGLARDVGVEPAGVFTTFVDLGLFTATPPAPLPAEPTALFVGVLELYKNIDGLDAAWRLAAPRVNGARLRLVGSRFTGRARARARVRSARSDLVGGATDRRGRCVQAFDEATCLILPSRSEGLPRIAVEALCRGRSVVAARGGGIPDIIEDDVNGLLVSPDDVAALAAGIERVLTDPDLAARLGDGAAASAPKWTATPEQYAERMAALVDETIAAHAQAAAAS